MSELHPSLEAAFTDVRRAYRLLYVYHRRVRDLLQLIDARLAAEGLEFQHWRPLHFNPPARRSTKFFQPGTWAWDMLPGYAMETLWVGQDSQRDLTRRVFVMVHADTEWPGRGAEPDSAGFGPVEASESIIEWVVWAGPGTSPDWGSALESVKAAKRFGVEGRHPFEIGKHQYAYTYDWRHLHAIPDGDAVAREVAAPMVSALQAG